MSIPKGLDRFGGKVIPSQRHNIDAAGASGNSFEQHEGRRVLHNAADSSDKRISPYCRKMMNRHSP